MQRALRLTLIKRRELRQLQLYHPLWYLGAVTLPKTNIQLRRRRKHARPQEWNINNALGAAMLPRSCRQLGRQKTNALGAATLPRSCR